MKCIMKEFKLRIENSKDFFVLISAVKALLDEVTIELNDEKLHLYGMDTSHIVKVDVELSKKYFDDFKVNYIQDFSIKLDLMNTILKRANNEQLTLNADIKQNKLICFFKGESTEREFSLGILSEVNKFENTGPDNLDNFNNCNFDLDTKIFARTLKDLTIFNDWATFSLNADKFIASVEGDGNNAQISMNTSVKVASLQTSAYSLPYLMDIMKVRPLAESVSVTFRSDLPIIFEFKLANGKVTYILAPRVEDEDEELDSEDEEDESDEVETEVIGK